MLTESEARARLRYLLAVMLLAVGCGRSVTAPDVTAPDMPVAEEPQPTWRQDRGDLLNWFLGQRQQSLNSATVNRSPAGGVGLSALSMSWEGTEHSGQARYAKGPQGFPSWELYRWDATHVYLLEDHGRNADTYTFSHGPWFARRAKLGDGGRARGNRIQHYDEACQPTTSSWWDYEWRFSGQGRMDFGGAVGTQDYITVDYVWGTGNVERYFYTWDWGWVRHQYFWAGTLKHDYVMNEPGTVLAVGSECR